MRAPLTIGYVVLVLLGGGASAAGFTANTVLQVLGACLIGWSLIGRAAPAGGKRPTWWPAALALAVLAIVQFLPLPAALWGSLPGRGVVSEGYRLLGVAPGWGTLSLAPWRSLESVTWWIPALAALLALSHPAGPGPRPLAIAIVVVGLVSIAFGAMQVGGGAAYIYEVTNFGLGVGFFANSNHQGNFLLVCLILLGAVVADTPVTRRRDTKLASRVTGGAAGLVLVVGILLSGSLACYLFLGPVLIAVALMHRPDIEFARWQVALACGLTVAAVVGILFFGSDNDLVKKGAIEGLSRGEFLANGLDMMRDFAPFGSGLGTFIQLYPSYETVDTVGSTFVNHAHNDWLELLIEAGVVGLVALGLFLVWFVQRVTAVWSQERSSVFRCAGTAIVVLQLVHSLGDYPLRTAALSSMLALGCALMVAQARPGVGKGRSKAHGRSQDQGLGRVRL